MLMIKLPALEKAEVRRLIEALENHCAHIRTAQPDDVSEYERLAQMLKRTAKLDPAQN